MGFFVSVGREELKEVALAILALPIDYFDKRFIIDCMLYPSFIMSLK